MRNRSGKWGLMNRCNGGLSSSDTGPDWREGVSSTKGSQQQNNLGVSAAEEYGTGGLSSSRIRGSQQQKNMGVSAAEKYGNGGLSSSRIWGSQQHQRGLSSMQGFEPRSSYEHYLDHSRSRVGCHSV